MPAPIFRDLVEFPDSITMFRRGGRFESESFRSGALVRSVVAGNVVMRLVTGPDWTFVATGTQEQQTEQSFTAGQEAAIRMSWQLSTARNNVLNVGIRVEVSMRGEGNVQTREKVMNVVYASLLQQFMGGVRRMFRSREENPE